MTPGYEVAHHAERAAIDSLLGAGAFTIGRVLIERGVAARRVATKQNLNHVGGFGKQEWLQDGE